MWDLSGFGRSFSEMHSLRTPKSTFLEEPVRKVLIGKLMGYVIKPDS